MDAFAPDFAISEIALAARRLSLRAPGGRALLNDLSFELADRQRLAIVGPECFSVVLPWPS